MKPKSIARALVRAAKRPFHRRPRIVMTLLCRDEEDIVGYNIAYHLAQGVDFVVATDNASKDRTPLLLERFVRLGKLHLIREPSLTHDQAIWVTRMARMAATRFDADWVINNDADEFWLSRDGTLRAAFETVPPDAHCLSVQRFDVLPPRDIGPKFFESMIVRRNDGQSVYGSCLLNKVCHRAVLDIHVSDGNHFVTRRGQQLAERPDHALECLHFPLRSTAQLERKIRQGAEALALNKRVARGIGHHWRKINRDYLAHGRQDEFYMECAPTSERIDAGLASGQLAKDTRIRDALRQLDLSLADPDHR
ncbi:MAG: glycosyltransferase family 2 protein [Dongiaceae bacterium]